MPPEPGVGWSAPDQAGIVSDYRKTKTPGVYVRHQKACPTATQDDARCRCAPSFRGRRWDAMAGSMAWSPTFSGRAEVFSWLVANDKGQSAVQQVLEAGPTFSALAAEWLDGVRTGSIGRRRGKRSVGYSDTTLEGYMRSLRYVLEPEFGPRPAARIEPREWQIWVDRLSREGLSRSRIANHVAVVRAIYGWAARPTRRLVEVNPLLGIELPPSDEKPRERVADAEEAAALLAALEPADRVPYALAFYAGLRRAEIRRLEWPDVQLDGYRLIVRKAKSEAGTGRRPPIAEPLRPILLSEFMRQGRREVGAVSAKSVMSGKIAERARERWTTAGLEPITLHECRHTYASFLDGCGVHAPRAHGIHGSQLAPGDGALREAAAASR